MQKIKPMSNPRPARELDWKIMELMLRMDPWLERQSLL